MKLCRGVAATGSGTMNIGFLSTYPPRQCGLATFTEDLANEFGGETLIRPSILAVADKEEYKNPQVRYILSQHDRKCYPLAALWANAHLDLLVIEHEFGIFGGECGEYILDLAQKLEIPFIVTTHTVLLEPYRKHWTILHELGRLGAKVVTMARNSIPLLTGIYGMDPEKIVFIPQGIPAMQTQSREKLKSDYGWQDTAVISSFGLANPFKGYEYGIEAVAEIVPEHKNLIYLILGKTHPNVKGIIGEKYRHYLMYQAERLGVREHIHFIDKYLSKREIVTYLSLSDIYLSPYLTKDQAVSATLAYAMGCGRVIVSTPYPYAEEMLGDGRGLLADFNDAGSLAACIRAVLDDPVRKKEMERKTLAVAKTMSWPTVAGQYAELFKNILCPV